MARIHLSQLNPEGSLNITGSFSVAGSTVLYQTDSNIAALILSGAMSVVQAQLDSQIVSASISVQNLGSLADRSSDATLDLSEGDDF